MQDCGYKVKINNKESFIKIKDRPANSKFFNADSELDSWVEENFYLNPKNLERLRKYSKGKDIIFDTKAEATAQSNALEIIDKITSSLDARTDKKAINTLGYVYDERYDTIELGIDEEQKFQNLISVTKYINTTGGKRDIRRAGVTGSDMSEYRPKFEEKVEKALMPEYPDFIKNHGNDASAEIAWRNYVSERKKTLWAKFKWKCKLAQFGGEDVHKMFEVHALEKMGKKAEIPPGFVLTTTDQAEAKTTTKQIFDDLCKKYNFSESAVFLPEFTVYSENIDGPTKRLLKETLDKSVNGVLGRIDLLVIDKGKAYIFDFKTSGRENGVGDWSETSNIVINQNEWWPSTKKLEAIEQIALYAAILEQWGIEFGGGEVVPIMLEFYKDSDGYPDDAKVDFVTKDGLTIAKADSEGGRKNIKSLRLDRSAESFSEPLKNSSAPHIQRRLGWARGLISAIKPLDIGEIKDIETDWKYLFGERIGRNENVFKATVNFYLGLDEEGKQIGESRITELSSDDYMRAKGYNYKMYCSPKVDLGLIAPGHSGKGVVFFKTNDESEVRPFLEKYCEALNRIKAEENNTLATNISELIEMDDYQDGLDKALSDFVGDDPKRKAYLGSILMPYLNGNWKLYGARDSENQLLKEGIFIFYSNSEIEVVVLTRDSVQYEINFGTKRRPLKTILNGITNVRQDEWNIMSSSIGNMHLIKALDIIARDLSIIRNGELKIRGVTTINPWHMQSVWADNDRLYENWKRICSLAVNDGKRLPTLAKEFFVPSVQSAIEKAQDILYSSPLWNYVRNPFTNGLKTENDIIKLLRIIKDKDSTAFNSDGTANVNTENGYAAGCLLNALALNRKLRVPIEHDSGKVLEGGILPEGLYMSTPGNSRSITVRSLARLTGDFWENFHTLNNNRIDEVNKHLKRIYELMGYNPNITSRKKFWAQFFEHADRRVSKTMRIRNFSDPFWKGMDEVKKEFKFILDMLAKYKDIRPKGTETYEQADTDRYYEIPLSKGSLTDTFRLNIAQKGMKGAFDVVKAKYQSFKRGSEQFFYGDEDIYLKDEKEHKDTEDLTQAFMNSYCRYTPQQRDEWTKNDTTVYTTDLEVILGNVIAAQSVAEASETYGYLYAAIKSLLAMNEKFGGQKLPELSQYVADFITKIYKGHSIMDPSNRALAEVIQAIKGFTSKLALGFNTRAFTREMLVSAYTLFLRAGNNKLDNVDVDDVAFGLRYVLTKAPANINKDELIGQLNRYFGMAGQGRNEMSKANFISDFGLRTIDMDNVMFLGTTIPDNYFRMAVLIGKLHADGCLEALSLDENGVLKYDPKKDSRFAKYLTDTEIPMFKEYDSSMGSPQLYMKAKTLWVNNLEEWNTVHPDRNYASLPMPYPPSMMRSIQHMAGQLFGFFDEDQKSLMTFQLIGSSLMQYRTWLSAKIDQWIKKGGFTNVWRQVHKKNEDGKYLYILEHTVEEIREGASPIEFITEDEITEDMVKRGKITPYIVEEGTYSEGMVQSVVAFTDVLIHMGPKEFLDMWKNDPVARGNFICSIIDMWGCMLFAGLIRLIFGEDVVKHKNAQPWLTQWTYGVLMGFAEDGPIHQVLGSMIGDWNPPSLMTLQHLAKTTQSVLHGNKTVPQGFLESFGATKEFSGFFRQ